MTRGREVARTEDDRMTTKWTRTRVRRSAAAMIGAAALLAAAGGGAAARDRADPVDKQQQKLEKQQKKEQAQHEKEQKKRDKADARQREKAGQTDNAGKAADATDPAIQPAAGLTAAQRLARVVDLLGANDEPTARVELKALLAETPNAREALVLQQSIVGNPYDIVPRGSFSYIVEPGDSFITLARDYLGDSYKFYALSRIAGIAGNMLKPGDTIQIPGRLRDPVRPGAVRTRPRPAPRHAAATGAPAGAPAAGPAAAAGPQADPAAALRLRRQGLEQMTAGRINSAVDRLGRAQQLDPDNKAIAADLARAKRIQGAVRTR